MYTFSRYLAMYFAWALGIAETWIFLSTDEFWPLSFDDYLAVALMLWCAKFARFQQGVVLLSAGWAFVVGNLYALLFNFNDQTASSLVQMIALSIGLGVSILGLLSSLLASRAFFGDNKRTV